MYEYKAKVEKVTDSDTYLLSIQLGFYIEIQHQVRLLGVDAFETKEIRGNSPEQVEVGKAGKEYFKNWLTGKDVLIHTVKDKSDKYGRFLADMYCEGIYVNDEIVRLGYGVRITR